MAFIDLLPIQLFVLGFAGIIVAGMTVRSAFLYTKGEKHYRSLKGGAIALGAIGLYMFLSGLFGQFTWPLPGSYNIEYYDLYPLIGLLFIALAFSVDREIDKQNVGLFGLLLGIAAIYYGYSGYAQGLSEAPLVLLGLFTCFGIAGILSYPVTVMLDRLDMKIKPKQVWWKVVSLLFILFLVLGSLLAIVVAGSAIPVHLASAP